jgi:hypothetical protein
MRHLAPGFSRSVVLIAVISGLATIGQYLVWTVARRGRHPRAMVY